MQVFTNGIIAGLGISLLGLAFAVVYVPARVFHLALGGVYAAAPFIAWACVQRHLPLMLSLLVGLLAGIGLSIACEVINHWRLERVGASAGAHLISSLGIYIVLVQVVVLVWGTDTKVLQTGVGAVAHFGKVALTQAQLTSAGVCIVCLIAFGAWLRFTNLGLKYRALAENPSEFALRGHNVRSARLLGFGISGLFAAAVALLVANDVGFDPNGGLDALLLAAVAVIIGGRHSFAGVVAGGLLLGVVRAEVSWFLSTQWQEAMTFLLLAIFLFVRPYGLVGKAGRLEAEA
jgi:branched-chain amino acid transport system permease protein